MGSPMVDDGRSAALSSFEAAAQEDPDKLCLLRINLYDSTSGKCMWAPPCSFTS